MLMMRVLGENALYFYYFVSIQWRNLVTAKPVLTVVTGVGENTTLVKSGDAAPICSKQRK